MRSSETSIGNAGAFPPPSEWRTAPFERRATSESRSPREGASTNSWSRFSCCRREPSNRGRFSVICCRARRRTGCRRLIHVPVASILSYGETACPFQNSASADRHMAPAQSTTLNHATAAISSKVGFQKQSLENITGAVSFHKRRVHHRTVPMGDDCPDQLAVGSIPNNAKGPGVTVPSPLQSA